MRLLALLILLTDPIFCQTPIINYVNDTSTLAYAIRETFRIASWSECESKCGRLVG